MKWITYFINIAGLVIASVWLVKSSYDFEPLLAVIGFAGALIIVVLEQQDGVIKKFKAPPLQHKRSLNIPILLYYVLLLALILWLVIRFDQGTTIGINGDNNDNNQIQIK